MGWLVNRWSEPESRAAVAGLATAVGAYASGAASGQSTALAVLGCALAFVLPGSKPK